MQQSKASTPRHYHWTTHEGIDDGGISTGIGFTISWQRGTIQAADHNGAHLIDVIDACINRLEHFQEGKLADNHNETALKHLHAARQELWRRRAGRAAAVTLDTHKV